jgi:hypothetical protein
MEIDRISSATNRLMLFFEIFGLLLLLLLLALFYLNQGLIDLFFSSDELMLPAFLSDLFLHHGHYKDWSLSPAPHFFPDILLYVVIFFVTKNIYLQFLFNLCLQSILFYLAVKYVYSHFFEKYKASIFAYAAVVPIYLLAMHEKLPFIAVLLPIAHTGEFIIGTYLLGIQLKNIEDTHNKNIQKEFVVLTSVFSFLAGLSDLLFVPQFAAAFFLSYFLFFITGSIKFQNLLYNGVFPFFAALGGIYLAKCIVPTNILFGYLAQPSLKKITLATLHHQFSVLMTMLQADMHGILRVIYILFYVFIFFVIAARFICVKNNNVSKNLIFLSIFVFFSVAVSLAVLLCLAENHVTSRYIIPVYFFPILFFFSLHSVANQFLLIVKPMFGLAGLPILFLLWNLLSLINKPGFEIKMGYYPAYIACIDSALKNYDNHGIAEYSNANLITMLSKTNAQVVPVHAENLSIYPWAMNLKKFSNSYSFAIIDVDPRGSQTPFYQNTVEAFNGKPIKAIVCATKKLLFYKKDQLKIPYFNQSGDQFTWPAFLLFSQFSDNVIANSRVANETTGAGFLTYGPYIVLPEGRYQFSLSYSSRAPVTTQVAHWDSSLLDVTKGPPKEEILVNGMLFGTAGRNKILEGNFIIPKQFAKNVTEVRVFFLGRKNLTIRSLTIKKV